MERKGILVHTNNTWHRPCRKSERKPEDLIGSRVRYFRAMRLVKRQERHKSRVCKPSCVTMSISPNSICNHSVDASDPLDRGKTINSMVIDLTARAMHIAWGNPCDNPFHTYQLDA